MTTRARSFALLTAAALATLLQPVAFAANVTVTASGMAFSPSTVTIHTGDSVTFRNQGGSHNVKADNNSFRCSNGCDDQGGNGAISSSAWEFTRTFNAEGSIGYHCELHGFVGGGMHGTIVVQADTGGGGGGGGGGGQAGTLQFSLGAYTVTEGTAHAQIGVTRTGGDDGAVSVHFATSGQTATAGSDFTNTSGTLNWADNDDAPKVFQVSITNDAAAEGNETVLLTLSAPTGGATLGTATAQLTIFDNDSGGTVPASPAKLHAVSTSLGGAVLAWQDKSNNETRFRLEGRRLDETAFTDRGTTPANTTQLAVGGLASGTAFVFRVRAENAAGVSAFSEETLVTTDVAPSACVADGQTLCITNGRFRVSTHWRTASAQGPGGAIPLASSPDSGLFFFFSPSNIEMLVKVLNACTLQPPRYWVFFAATTNVEFTVTVTDTQTGKGRTYFNPLGRPAPPVQDTDAFATCP